MMFFIFFFFQAEDGIRDRNVTGVQTCALPISFSTVQYSGQAHSKGKVPIFGKILCTEQWCQQKQDNKTKNRTANRFHFIPPTNSSEPHFALWRLFWLQRQIGRAHV